jgi:hypothetical protein
MADPSPGAGPERGPAPGTPRWVKISGIILGVLVLLFVLMLFLGGGPGGHGPWQHTSSSAGHEAPSISVVAAEHSLSGGGR